MLKNKYQKRWFWGSVSLAFAFLVITRFFLIPYALKEPIGGILEIVKAILDNLLAALVASISVTLLLLWLTPPRTESTIIEAVESPYIEEVLRQGRDRVTEYWYKGNTGRYFRAVTLPELAQQARSQNGTKNVFLIILDPRNTKACADYASYRRGLKSATRDNPWTERRVQLELNSIIISAYAWKAQEPALLINVALTDIFSFFRIDFSSRLAVITCEDERQPALMCESDSLFHKLYREDLYSNLAQAKPLPKNNIAGIPIQQLNLNNTRKLMRDLGLDSQNLNDSDINEIITLSKKADNPY